MRTLLLSLLKISNTKFSFSDIVRSSLVIAMIFLSNVSIAQISSTGVGGDWSLPGTWVGGVVPTSSDDVIIAAGANVTIRGPYDVITPATANSLTIDGNLTIGGGSAADRVLQISTFLLINAGGTLTNNGVADHRINLGGNFTNNGTFIPRVEITLPTPSVGTIQIVFNGAVPQLIDGTSSTQTFEGITINKSAGDVTVGVGITTINAASFTQTLGNFTAPPTFSVLGNMTLTAGTYNAGTSTLIGGNYFRNGATSVFNAGSGTVTFNGASQTLGGVTSATGFYNLVISGNLIANYNIDVLNNLSVADGGTLTLGGYNYNVAGTTTIGGGVSGSLVFSSTAGSKFFTGLVSISSGATWNNTIGESAHFYGGISNSGTFTAGAGQYLFEVNSQTLTGTLVIADVFINAGVTLLNSNTLTVSTILSGGGTLQQGLNSTLNIGGSATIAVLNASASPNTVNYIGAAQSVRGANYSNLGLSGTGLKTMSNLINTISGNLDLSGTASAITQSNITINGNLSIGTGSSLTNGTFTLSIGGALSGDGSIIQSTNSILNINGSSTLASINASATGNTVNYNAGSPAVIPGTYTNLVLNQSSGNASLNGNISVAGTLTLSTGNLDLVNNNLTLESTATLSILTPSSSRMIVISGTGVMRKGVTAVGPFTFPIGESTGTTEYSPVTVNVTSANGFVGAYISASVVDAKSSFNNSTTDYLTRYWKITQTGISNSVVTVTGTYIGSDVVGTAGNAVAAQLSGTFNQLTNGWKKFTALTGTLTATGAVLVDGETSEFTGITGANPTVAINGGNVAVCEGTAVALSTTATGIPTVVYSWSPATGLSATNVPNPTATPALTTIYTVTIYDGNGISTSSNTTITVDPLPAQKVVSDPSTCIGTGVNITLTGSVTGVNYQLRLDSDDSNVGSAVAGTGGDITFSVNPAATTTYNVLATVVATSCSQEMTDKSTVTVNALPAQKVVSDPSTCIGTGVNITLTGSVIGVNYQLRLDSDDSNVGSAVAGTGGDITFSVNPAATTIYNVLATVVATSCSLEMTDKSTVTVNELPAQKVVSDPSTCIGTAVNITLTGSVTGVNYQLRLDIDDSNVGTAVAGTGGDITFSVNPASTTTYNVLATVVATSCSIEMTDKSTVTVNPLPALPTVSNVSYCLNATATALTATALANHTLQWYGTNSIGGTASITAPTPVTTAAGTTTYYVSQKNNTTGCEGARASITVTVNALPTVSTPAATLQVGSVMTASPSTGGTWTSSDPGVATITNAGLITGVSEGTVTFTFTNTTTGCINTTASVAVNDLPAVSIPSNKLCVGSTMVLSPATGGSWVTSDAGVATIDNTGLVTGISAGTVTFTFTETSTGLSNTTPTVTISDIPAVSLPSDNLCVDASMTLSPSVGGAWESSDITVATIDNTGLVTGVSAGTVSFTFTETTSGCSNTTPSLTINALPVVSAATGVCVGGTIALSPSAGGTWVSSNNSIATVTNAGVVTGVSEGTVTFTFTSTSTSCSNTTETVTVAPLPAKPTITSSNISSATPTLTSSSDTGNQWFRNNVAIVGAINKTLTVTESGSYTVQVTTNGCAGPVSNAVDIVITGIEDHIISGQGRIYPNPAKEVIQVDWSDFKTGVNIDVKIYDQVGRSIMTKVMTTSDNQLDVRSLVGGSYIFLARQDEKLMIQRFIKE